MFLYIFRSASKNMSLQPKPQVIRSSVRKQHMSDTSTITETIVESTKNQGHINFAQLADTATYGK